MNQTIYDYFGVNLMWDVATNILAGVVIGVLGVFAVMGLFQWIKRKSLWKVDKELLWMIPFLVAILVVYIVFNKIWIINMRPDGSEPSFPSSHVLMTVTIFMMVGVALPKYIKSKKIRVWLDVLMWMGILVMGFGRVASGMHWMTDVIGGMIWGMIFGVAYWCVLEQIRSGGGVIGKSKRYKLIDVKEKNE